MERFSIFIFFWLILLPNELHSHINHYNKIKVLKYDLFLNNELIGYHNFEFNRINGKLHVVGSGYFKVNKLGIDLMKYRTKSNGIYKDNMLLEFNSETLQNDKKKYVRIKSDKKKLLIDGSSFNGKTTYDSIISDLWNHEIVLKQHQISSISGRVINQEVKYLGKDKVSIKNKEFNTINFHLFSKNEKPMNEKKINLKIWYDEASLIWIKASYEKFGTWEYRLNEVKY